MLYNANPQRPHSDRRFQPTIGWDTLNWSSPVPEYGEEVGEAPRIRLNWRAKLVPVTRLPEAARSRRLPDPIREVLRKTIPNRLLWSN
jgi:hypothetical protein